MIYLCWKSYFPTTWISVVFQCSLGTSGQPKIVVLLLHSGQEAVQDSCQAVTGSRDFWHRLDLFPIFKHRWSVQKLWPRSTGEIKAGYKFKKDDTWRAAVGLERINVGDKDFDPSKCCQTCQGTYPDTEAWSKNLHKKTCNCFSFPDDFDASPFELKHENYTIGYCNPKCE